MSDVTRVLIMAAATFLLRASPILWIRDAERVPRWVKRWLEYVPPAVLAALVAPEMLARTGPRIPGITLAYVACLVTALRTRSIVLPLLAAIATLAVAGLF